MIKFLRVICSPRGQVSESYKLSQKIVGFLLRGEPTAVLVDRVIAGGAVSHIDSNYATALGATQQSSAEISPKGSMSLSEELIQELESSDFVVIGTPMHNFTVPSALKAWIDHIVRDRQRFNSTTEGYAGTLRDRPVFVAVSSGGRYSGERVRQPDFLTPYLKAILGTIGLHDQREFLAGGHWRSMTALACFPGRINTRQARSEIMTLTGRCFCGAIELQVTGSPEAMGYCHCGSCRLWSTGPVTAFSLWKTEEVKITSGAKHIRTFEKTPRSQRQFCTCAVGI
jgi:FMN-dependent NADH-azoreductase